MGDAVNRTSIEWTDFTTNPIRYRDPEGRSVHGCIKVSAGCANCYASAMRWRYEYVCRCCLRAGRAPWATCTLCPDCRRDACEFRPPCRWRSLQPELRASEAP